MNQKIRYGEGKCLTKLLVLAKENIQKEMPKNEY